MRPALGRVPLSVIVLQLGVSMAHAAEEMPAEIIAAQIRDQGYACDKALSTTRDGEHLDDAVWILKCQNVAVYTGHLAPECPGWPFGCNSETNTRKHETSSVNC